MVPEFFCPLFTSATTFVASASILGVLVVFICWKARDRMLLPVDVAVLTSAISFAIVSVVFSYEVDVCELVSVKSAFTETQQLPMTMESIYKSPCYIDRKDVHDWLTKLVSPDMHPKVYYPVVGPYGTGKSTALINVVRNHHYGPGIKYLSVPSKCQEFSDYLAQQFTIDVGRVRFYRPDYTPIQRLYRYIMQSVIDDKGSQTMDSQVQRSLNIIETAAAAISVEKKLAPTLIIDNIDHLLTCGDQGIQTLFTLQDFAKYAADFGILNIVFASSEGTVASMLLKRSSSSRMAWNTFIGDISSEQAMDYLRCKLPRTANDILTEVVQLVGGRFVDLNTAIGNLRVGEKKIHVLRNILYERVKNEMERLNITVRPTRKISDTMLSNVTWSVAQEIIYSKEKKITMDHFREKSDSLSIDERRNLLSANLFMAQVHEQQVEFQSTVVKSYFMDCLSSNTNAN